MSTQTTITATFIPNRTARIVFEKPHGGIPSIMTIDESVTILPDGSLTHKTAGNMFATYDENDPLDVALYQALEAKVLSMRAKRDTPPAEVTTDVPLPEGTE